MPHVLDQIVFADDPFAMTDNVLQKVENLRLDIDQFGPTPQFLPINIKGIIFELVDQSGCPRESRPLKAF